MSLIIPIDASAARSGGLGDWWQKSCRAIIDPVRFFRLDFPELSTSSLLTLGIAHAWLASVLAFFVKTIHGVLMDRMLEVWSERFLHSGDSAVQLGFSSREFLMSSGFLVLAPYILLLQLPFLAFFLFIFSKVMIEDKGTAAEPVTFTAILRIQAVALFGQWYSVVPLLGGLLAFFAGAVYTVTGIRERFGVSNRRAVAVVVAPYLFMTMLLVLALLVVLGIMIDSLSGDIANIDFSALANDLF